MKYKYKIVEEKKSFSCLPQFGEEVQPSFNQWAEAVLNKYGDTGWEVVHWKAFYETHNEAYVCEITLRRKIEDPSKMTKSVEEIVATRSRVELWNTYLDEG